METATYKPTTDEIKRLREETDAGMIDCRNALVKCNGDYEAAKRHLSEQGMARAAKKAERVANEGLIGSYVHAGGKIGVLVEVNCETDFVARNDRFVELVRDVAMHVAAMKPEYLDRESVPESIVDERKAEFAKSVPAGKPPAVAEKIVEGKLGKWFEEHCLLDQQFVKDDAITVGELVSGTSGVLGERIRVRRFVRYALGEE
ncbi:MAG: translation elongation factor Ts [Candidatus Eremiobacteraeota bacterium]|nr:translation elongation factor Ts [Candidatus Eremiobacteraeota bacterium]